MQEDIDNKEYDFEATLVFVFKGKKVLLAPKKAKIGKDRWNGYGGEVEPCDPSIEFRATLEMWQECEMICAEEDLKQVAIGYFSNIKDSGEIFVCKVHVFLAEEKKCAGVPTATNEMGMSEWFEIGELPFEKMMAADRHWIPEIFKGRKIIVRATLRNGQAELVGKVEIQDVESFE
ncbi:MAG: hypothetical protein HGA36_00475 [Candidatus Moranbacteria bacterium]|nr:hypothetical protein [Candidatus Moranbacteria bacterium]